MPMDNSWLPLSSSEQIVNKLLVNPQITKLADQGNGQLIREFFQRLLTPSDDAQIFNEMPLMSEGTSPLTIPEIDDAGTQAVVDKSVDELWPTSRYKRATTQSASSKPPDYIPSLPSGVPSAPGMPGASNGGQQTPTLIIGGFNALVIPVSGISPSNMAGFMQTAEQLGNSNPVKPFQTEP